MFMQAAGKVVVGIILVVASAWWIVQGSAKYFCINGYCRSGIGDFLTVINGAVPVLVFLLGIFIVWLEMDEMKVEKELRRRK